MIPATARMIGARRGWFLAFLLVAPFLFLFSRLDGPALSSECLQTVSVGGGARFVHVCDTYSITSQMENLEAFITQPNPWRGRPVYILTATGFASALSPVAVGVRHLLAGHLSGDFNRKEFLRRFPAYFALCVMNFAILGFALALALHLGGHDGNGCALGLAAVVATCDFMHSLFWSQHPSFLNILISLGAAWYYVEGFSAAVQSRSRVLWLGLFQALATLDYAYAAIWVPAYVLGMGACVIGQRREGGQVGRLALFLATGCGPYAAWLLINAFWLHVSISYEADVCRQFVWILDAAKEGHLWDAMILKGRAFLPALIESQGIPGLIALLSFAILCVGRGGGKRWGAMVRDPVMTGAVVAILGLASFNYLQGYYEPRLIHGVTLALFLMVCREAQLTGREGTGTVLLFTAAGIQVVLAFLMPPITLT